MAFDSWTLRGDEPRDLFASCAPHKGIKVFEFIGMAVVAWILYLLIKSFLRAKSTTRSNEIGKEARHIATTTLGVPIAYYNHSVATAMDEVKAAALHLKNTSDRHKHFSWPRLIAWSIYFGFRHECEQYQNGNPMCQSRFDRLAIPSDVVISTLLMQPDELLET